MKEVGLEFLRWLSMPIVVVLMLLGLGIFAVKKVISGWLKSHEARSSRHHW